ncbi:MAG: hypothetical protein M3Z08_04815 [Chloroflexota bacterium]|nr:hypothetical protein [Chloroflexota bacterium]
MLDHNELLPEEQASPALVAELRTAYQMQPQEKQVLARVHARLAQNAQPIPLPESAQVNGHIQPQRVTSPAALPSRSSRPRQRWLPHLNALAAVLFVGLLVGSLVLTFSVLNHRTTVGSPPTSRTSGISMVLVSTEKDHHPSLAQMEATGTLLSKRFTSFGLKRSSVHVVRTHGQFALQVELPHFRGNEQQILALLLAPGVGAFWLTGGPDAITEGTTFHPEKHTQYNPGGLPRFTNRDFDPKSLKVSIDSQTGQVQIDFNMQGNAIKGFQLYTAHNIGHFLVFTLDGKVVQSAIINSAISGSAVITSRFTQQQATAIVSALKYGPLPVTLKKLP